MRSAPLDAAILIRTGTRRLLVSWTTQDSATFHALKSSFRASFPAGDATWQPDDRCWSVPAHRRRRLEEWAWMHVDPAAVTWGRADDTDWAPGGRESAAVASVDQAYRMLHLRRSAPLWAAEAVHKAAIKRHHPDVGGDHATAVAVNEALAVIREQAQLEAVS